MFLPRKWPPLSTCPAHPLGQFHPGRIGRGHRGCGLERIVHTMPRSAFASRREPAAASRRGRIAGHRPYSGQVSRRQRLAGTRPVQPDHAGVEDAGVRELWRTSSTLHFSVSTSNLEEWRPLVTALGGPANLPFRVDGNATFNGVAGGTFSAPTLAGTLVAEDFEFTLPATSRTPEQQVHWDSLAASIQLSSHDLASSRRHAAAR